MTEVDSVLPEGSNSSSPAASPAFSSASSSPPTVTVQSSTTSGAAETTTTATAAAATAVPAPDTCVATTPATTIATKTATNNTKDNGIALADASSAVVVVASGGVGVGVSASANMAPSDSIQACKERRPDAVSEDADGVVKPMEVDDEADGEREEEEEEEEEVAEEDGEVMREDGEEDNSQITSSTENGGPVGDGAGGDDVAENSRSSPEPPAEKHEAHHAAEDAAVTAKKSEGSGCDSSSCENVTTSACDTNSSAHNNDAIAPSEKKSVGDDDDDDVAVVATTKSHSDEESSDNAKAVLRTPVTDGEDEKPAAPKVADNETTAAADEPSKAGETKSNGSVVYDADEEKEPRPSTPAAEPMDTSTDGEDAAPKALATGQKENGIDRTKDDIVSLDDDSDEEDISCDPLALPKHSNGDGAVAALPNKSAPMPKKESLSSDSDGAVIIGSDSENEAVPMRGRPMPLPPLSAAAAGAQSKEAPQMIDDDDDDCVVIEDDTPAPMPVASDLSKRKSGNSDIGGGSAGGGGSNNSFAMDEQPPSKRQRSNNGNAVPSGIGMGTGGMLSGGSGNNNLNQITIKDARSLMPQEIGTKRGADGNIYPVTITPAQSLMQQGPPKLVPMANPNNAMPPLPPGMPGIGLSNANLLPGLTDDMFVLEAPSFIVPYIYEKPPPDNLKDVIKDIQAKHQLSKEDLAEADKSDEFDMMTEQNKEDRDEKSADTASGSSSSKNKRKRRRNDDESWSEESDEDEDDDDDDSESGMRTKVLIKEASDDLTAIKGAIKPAAAMVQSSATPSGTSARPGQENYFESPLGKFFMDIGVGQVQEFVQTDLIRLQKRKMRKSIGKNITEFERAIAALSGNLEASKKKNTPFKFTMKRCEFCNFKSESALAMANHYETPHMNGIQYKCNFCTFEIRNATEIVYHMEAIHNIKARLIKPLPYHQCPNCGFEDNGKAKLGRHQPVCAKKFRPELNLAPPTDWEAPAKIPRIKPRHGLVGTATAYQAMAAQAAAQKAALASIQQQQQAAQARNLQAAALAAQTAAAKIRGRPPMMQKPVPGPNTTSMLRGPNQVRNPMPTNVVLPTNFQMAANQLLPHAANAMSKKNMPSVSITPLPRQSAVPPPTSPSTSKLSTTTSLKPGQNPNATGKTQFVICEICDYYIKDLEQLRTHMQSMHKVKIHPKMIYNRPPLNCQKCQFRFFTDQGLERHLLGSHGLVTSSMQEAANKSKDGGRCPVCGKTYLCKLLNHVSRDHHMTLKPAHLSYKCTVCTATFGMYKQFETHVYTAHSTVAKKAMDAKKSNAAPNAAPSSSNNQRNSLGMYNDSLLKPLKINDEITIIPQPASKPRITNMESHVID